MRLSGPGAPLGRRGVRVRSGLAAVAVLVALAVLVAQGSQLSFVAPVAAPVSAGTLAGAGVAGGSPALPAATQHQGVAAGVAAAGCATLAAVGLGRRSAFARANTGLSARAAEGEQQPAKPKKKVRITAFDSIRFFLIAYIVCGHFIAFAAPSAFATRAISQINVVVGAFFALSGYVAAYTTTEDGEQKANPKLLSTPSPKWILQRVFGYYPLHLLVLLLFSPVFIYPDVLFNGWPTALWHGFLSLTLTQAWFPMHAEIWNAPTWFLSALTFAMVSLPFALPVIAKQNKEQLRRTLAALFITGLLPKLGWCYDHSAWGLLEGAVSAKAMPNLAIFNTQRFNPFYAVVEVLLGAVACRLVMLDSAEGQKAPKTNVLSTLLPLAGMVGIVLLRAFNVIQLSDLLTRSVIFIPLFLRFLMSAHRASVLSKVTDPIVKILSSNLLVTLGGLAFPIFVVHGPLGQLFYKKVIATQLFGGPLNVVLGPWFFYVYLGIVVAAAWVLQKTFLSSKKVGELSEKAVNKLASVL